MEQAQGSTESTARQLARLLRENTELHYRIMRTERDLTQTRDLLEIAEREAVARQVVEREGRYAVEV